MTNIKESEVVHSTKFTKSYRMTKEYIVVWTTFLLLCYFHILLEIYSIEKKSMDSMKKKKDNPWMSFSVLWKIECDTGLE